MIALRVTVNDEAPVIAGSEELSVLTAIVTCTGKLGAVAMPERGDAISIDIHLGGLTARPSDRENEFLNWVGNRPLEVGDRISIEILEASRVDSVRERSAAGPGDKTAREKETFERIKAMYFELRGKYESES